MKRAAVVDYSVGNLFSVTAAIKKVGFEPELISDPDELLHADALVLPGVGAFSRGMSALIQRGLDDALRQAVKKGTPLLGICLGMQLLFDSSEEFGQHAGLALLPGRVVRIPPAADHEHYKVPHIAWSELAVPAGIDWSTTPLRNLRPGAAAYFVHSFHAVCANPKHRVAFIDYGSGELTAVVGDGQIWGAQFHPEKSGVVGLSLLSAFLDAQ